MTLSLTIWSRTFAIYRSAQICGESAMQEAPVLGKRSLSLGSIPGLGRSPGGGHGHTLQYSFLENPMVRGAWRAIVHRIPKSWEACSEAA